MASSYDRRKFAILPAEDDAGYELLRKSYKRFIWNFNDFQKNEPLAKGPSSKKRIKRF